MIILSVECTASPASVCIFDGDKILASSYVNVKITHSQTLMPMIDFALKSTLMNISDIDGIAVAAGPGSFTGVRIGISVAKGIAAPSDLPCVSVSSLEAIANMFLDRDCIICPVMDARCNQYYNALFRVKDGTVTRICEDRAILSEELINEINKLNDTVIICGDGAEKFFSELPGSDNIILADTTKRYQSAVGVALCAFPKFLSGQTLKSDRLLPLYLRLPQAQRELELKH